MSDIDLSSFLALNEENFNTTSAQTILQDLFEKSDISKASLARTAGMSEVYLHQIFAGRRKPSRNRLICICVGLKASFEKTQELLKLCSLAQLYPRNRRDAIIIHGLLHGVDPLQINDTLYAQDEETLY